MFATYVYMRNIISWYCSLFFGLVFLQYMQAVALFLSDCGPGLSVYVCPFLSVSLIDRITNTLNN